MTSETPSPLGKGPYDTFEVEGRRFDICDASGGFLAIVFNSDAKETYDPAAVARLFAASWSFYQAAKLRAKYERTTDAFDVRPAYEAWLAMEAQAMAIAEGRPLPADEAQDAEVRS